MVRTSCANSEVPFEIEIDSDLEYKTEDPGCRPVAFIPDINLIKLDDENIINAF